MRKMQIAAGALGIALLSLTAGCADKVADAMPGFTQRIEAAASKAEAAANRATEAASRAANSADRAEAAAQKAAAMFPHKLIK